MRMTPLHYAKEVLVASFARWEHGEAITTFGDLFVTALIAGTAAIGVSGRFPEQNHAIITYGLVGWMALLLLIVTPCRLWLKAQHQIDDLKEALKPTIKIAEVVEFPPLANGDPKLLGMRVVNDGPPQDNCLVKLLSLESVKDGQRPLGFLPLALSTQHHRGGPFHLRRGEDKKIYIASLHENRLSAPILVHFEEEGAHPISRGEWLLQIGVFSGAVPTKENFLLSIGQDGILRLQRHKAA